MFVRACVRVCVFVCVCVWVCVGVCVGCVCFLGVLGARTDGQERDECERVAEKAGREDEDEDTDALHPVGPPSMLAMLVMFKFVSYRV